MFLYSVKHWNYRKERDRDSCFISLGFCFDSAASDPFKGQNMTLISADHHLYVYLSAGKFLILSCYILSYFLHFLNGMKLKRISVTWKKKKSYLYSLTLCVIASAKTYFIRLLWMLNIDVLALLWRSPDSGTAHRQVIWVILSWHILTNKGSFIYCWWHHDHYTSHF